MKIYISGPNTGVNNYMENFRKASDKVWNISPDYIAVNPCTLPHNHGKTYQEYMREDIKALLECDFIYMLDGWEKSKGAIFELKIAEMCGILKLDI